MSTAAHSRHCLLALGGLLSLALAAPARAAAPAPPTKAAPPAEPKGPGPLEADPGCSVDATIVAGKKEQSLKLPCRQAMVIGTPIILGPAKIRIAVRPGPDAKGKSDPAAFKVVEYAEKTRTVLVDGTCPAGGQPVAFAIDAGGTSHVACLATAGGAALTHLAVKDGKAIPVGPATPVEAASKPRGLIVPSKGPAIWLYQRQQGTPSRTVIAQHLSPKGKVFPIEFPKEPAGPEASGMEALFLEGDTAYGLFTVVTEVLDDRLVTEYRKCALTESGMGPPQPVTTEPSRSPPCPFPTYVSVGSALELRLMEDAGPSLARVPGGRAVPGLTVSAPDLRVCAGGAAVEFSRGQKKVTVTEFFGGPSVPAWATCSPKFCILSYNLGDDSNRFVWFDL